MIFQTLYGILEHFITMMKLTIVVRLPGLNPGIPGAPEDPQPPANAEREKKEVLNFHVRRQNLVSTVILKQNNLKSRYIFLCPLQSV